RRGAARRGADGLAPKRGRRGRPGAVRHCQLADRAAPSHARQPRPRAGPVGAPARAFLRHARIPRAKRQPPTGSGNIPARMPKSLVRQALQGFQPYVPGEQPPDGEGWVKLNTNESPLPPSPRVLEAVKAAADDSLRLYPSPTAAPARTAIAAHFRVDPSHVLVGNGGDELIELCFRAFAGGGDEVAFPTPTYPLFEPLCRIHGAAASTHPTEVPWELPPSLGADPAPLKFIVNPNSPTGAPFDR